MGAAREGELYRITNWDSLYETAETRKLKRLAWVPLPNKHDGVGYNRFLLAAGARIAEAYAGWCAIIALASRLPDRGVLADETGPLSIEDISISTRLPEACIKAALEIAVKVGWISTKQENLLELPGTPGESPGVSEIGEEFPGRIEGKEGKGRERESSLSREPRYPPMDAEPDRPGLALALADELIPRHWQASNRARTITAINAKLTGAVNPDRVCEAIRQVHAQWADRGGSGNRQALEYWVHDENYHHGPPNVAALAPNQRSAATRSLIEEKMARRQNAAK